jgi:hypothetical protein
MRRYKIIFLADRTKIGEIAMHEGDIIDILDEPILGGVDSLDIGIDAQQSPVWQDLLEDRLSVPT